MSKFKITLPLIAAIIAIIGTTIGTEVTKANVSHQNADLYWYKYQLDDPSTLEFDQFAANPSVTCNPGGNICTKSFSSYQGATIPASQSGYIDVNSRQ